MPCRKTILNRLLASLNGPAAPVQRRVRQATPALDSLEGRIVLSHFGRRGHRLAARMAAAAQVSTITTTPAATTPATPTTTTGSTGTSTGTTGSTATDAGGCKGGPGASGTQDAQLTADLQKLQTDLTAAVGGSTVTDAQRQALGNDFRALRDAGVAVDRDALQTVADNLLTALADGSYDASTSAIPAAFNAAFTGPSGAALTPEQAALVTTAYTDFVAVARGLNLDSTELTTLAADKTAIQADLTRLGIANTDGHGPGQFATLDLVLGGGPGGPGFGGRGFGGRGFGAGHGRRF